LVQILPPLPKNTRGSARRCPFLRSASTPYFGEDLKSIGNIPFLYAFAGNLRITEMTRQVIDFSEPFHMFAFVQAAAGADDKVPGQSQGCDGLPEVLQGTGLGRLCFQQLRFNTGHDHDVAVKQVNHMFQVVDGTLDCTKAVDSPRFKK
jgi:hypothetical protein